MTEADEGFEVSAKHKIVGGAAMVAALAGIAVGLLDYPWHEETPRPLRHDAERRAIVAAALASGVRAPAPADAEAAQRTVAERNGGEAKPAARASGNERRRRVSKARSPARPALTIDARYEREVARYCAPGVAGVLCRETVKWRLCSGRWSQARRPGATRCRVVNGAMPSAG